MKLKIYRTCTSCPAALVCRAADVHYSSVCPRCKKPWLVLLPYKDSPGVYVVIFSPNMQCGDANLDWKCERSCPSCDGKLRWLEFENKQIYLMDIS